MIDPLDPTGPDAARQLFEQLKGQVHGHSYDAVITAAANLVINALRQAHSGRGAALSHFDEVVAKSRACLAEHYTAEGRRLQGVFAFPQTIHVPLLQNRNRF